MFETSNLLESLRETRNSGSHEATAQDLKAAILGLDDSVDDKLKSAARDGFALITGCSWEQANSKSRFSDGVMELQEGFKKRREAKDAELKAGMKSTTPCKKRKKGSKRLALEKTYPANKRLQRTARGRADTLHALDYHAAKTHQRFASGPIGLSVVRRALPGYYNVWE
ncbi:unnamed protein product [Sympodiomycopsis kandeliae]